MHPEKYSLTWHTYSDHLKSMMKELIMNEDFSDVTLVTEDKKQIKANINILSAFKDILKKEKVTSTVMYLRGIQYSIMQFIYLGEATFYEERMDEFISVAKLLEIKELCNAEAERNEEPEDEPLTTDSETFNENLKEQTIVSDHFTKKTKQERRREVVNLNGKYECKPCQKTFANKHNLTVHIQSKHEGIKYACDKCDNQFTQKSHLTTHIQSKHEGIKNVCDQCDYRATQKSHLITHIQSKHEGIRYACDQCNFQAKHQSHLTTHIQSKHEGIKYVCDQCDYQATLKCNLTTHIQSKHEGPSPFDLDF